MANNIWISGWAAHTPRLLRTGAHEPVLRGGRAWELLPLEVAEPLSSVTLVATCQVITKNTLGLKHLHLN